MLYFTSDTHFGSERTLELHRRPFASTIQMNVDIIGNWNRIVRMDDTVVHLGDFGDPHIIRALCFKKLYIIPGNHDIKNPGVVEELKKDPRVELWQSGKELTLADGKRYCLVHEPLSGFGRDKFYLFGHIHRLQLVKRNGINVSQDIHNFRPVDETNIMGLRKFIENHYDENVFTERCE